jgi:hypothetical protein
MGMEAELPPVVAKSQLAAFTEDKSEHFSTHNLTVCTMYTVCYIGQVRWNFFALRKHWLSPHAAHIIDPVFSHTSAHAFVVYVVPLQAI